MKFRGLLLVVLVGVMAGGTLAAPKPLDWNTVENKMNAWFQKAKELKENAKRFSQNLCIQFNNLFPQNTLCPKTINPYVPVVDSYYPPLQGQLPREFPTDYPRIPYNPHQGQETNHRDHPHQEPNHKEHPSHGQVPNHREPFYPDPNSNAGPFYPPLDRDNKNFHPHHNHHGFHHHGYYPHYPPYPPFPPHHHGQHPSGTFNPPNVEPFEPKPQGGNPTEKPVQEIPVEEPDQELPKEDEIPNQPDVEDNLPEPEGEFSDPEDGNDLKPIDLPTSKPEGGIDQPRVFPPPFIPPENDDEGLLDPDMAFEQEDMLNNDFDGNAIYNNDM